MTKHWTIKHAETLLNEPFIELMFKAQQVHRKYFNPLVIQKSTLLSIKTGNCPEDCKYCAQSARYKTGLKTQGLMQIDEILINAHKAKANGSSRFCMGAAWKHPQDRDMPYLENIIKEIKAMGMETCMTLGHLSDSQAKRLAKAGLDFYNHNLDTSPEFYNKITTTRNYQQRLDTLNNVRNSGIKVCSGGILGLGETIKDRASLLVQLANLPKPPESIPINMLVKIKGTPLENNEIIEPFEFIKTIAVTRIMIPASHIRLSAGRNQMSEQTQAMCFMAGANSIFYGCKLLTTSNSAEDKDIILFLKLGLKLENNQKNNESSIPNEILPNEQFYDATL
ncbi:biotin synthase BioB [Candidatus Pantoea edessiphila]|uniref:Biotin synthase n=1 Tax=Candidatus Pantoea edessiphila TaxID=2044610 RepID=A0A2P5T0F6_9GAMM|nr:biotin synthase BioB [Candidatus Pantoea edessiphila]PPI88065.1 biotin synthase BioB [Candidatus Pantoea edessiphila]